MESNIEKFEKVLDELRVIRDLDEYKSNSPHEFEELLDSLLKQYELIIKESHSLEDNDVIKANELIDKLVNAEPSLKELKEEFDKKTKSIFNLKELEKVRNNLINIVDLNNYKDAAPEKFDKDIEDIIKYFNSVVNVTNTDSKEYNQAISYIKDIVNKHPELKQLENILVKNNLFESKSTEEQLNELTHHFDKEKFTVKVESVTKEIEELKKRRITNKNELNNYRDLIDKYKKEILNNQSLTQEEKLELINKLDKNNQIISMLEILEQRDTGTPKL